jgi:hypothetical protein
MQKKLRARLIQAFAHLADKLPPGFRSFRGKTDYLWPGQIPFYAQTDNLWLFVVLYISPKSVDEFTVEFGWSRLRRYPEVLSVRCPCITPTHAEFDSDEYLNRLGVLWDSDYWWLVGPDSLGSKPAPQLDLNAALQDLEDKMRIFLLPYFSALMKHWNARE